MPGKIDGQVARVTDEGDLITDIDYSRWKDSPRDSSVRIIVDEEHETFGIYSQEHDQPVMTLIAVGDEESPLRLTLVGDSASMMLGVRTGAPIQILW